MNVKTKNQLTPSNATENISFRLREMIRNGELNSGDRLPPERDLAKKMGISRPTLRAGIRSLAALGFLETRQGSGNFVVNNADVPALESDQLKLLATLHDFSSEEMFEARITLEIRLTELAALRATDEQMAQMADEIAEMFAALDEPEIFLAHDIRFHKTIAAASGNRILTILMNLTAQVLLETRSKTVHRARDLRQAAEMHRKIYRAIRRHDAKTAGAAMREHLETTRKAQQLESEQVVADIR